MSLSITFMHHTNTGTPLRVPACLVVFWGRLKCRKTLPAATSLLGILEASPAVGQAGQHLNPRPPPH